MEYILYLLSFLVAGYLFGKLRPKRRSNMDIKIAMAKAELEFRRDSKNYWLFVDDYKRKSNPLKPPITFGKSYWTKTKN